LKKYLTKAEREKTLGQELIEQLEQRITDEFQRSRAVDKHSVVTELDDRSLISEEARRNQEKMKGKFKLMINHRLPMPLKIEKYANDPVAFYLHKKRNFINKLDVARKQQEDKQKQEEAILESIKRYATYKQRQEIGRNPVLDLTASVFES